jgi:hypothetical protein
LIGVRRVRKPKGFDLKVKKVGNDWLDAHPEARRPKDLWSPYRSKLEEGFRGLCGYAAMADFTGGTVDHFLSFRNYRNLAYEWKNYRFASDALNKTKGNLDDSVLDPFEVGEGWFEILLPSLQLRLTDRVPEAMRDKAEFTIGRLGLRDGERVVRWRRRWYALYQAGKLDLDGLEQVAPLLAAAVRRRGALKNGR